LEGTGTEIRLIYVRLQKHSEKRALTNPTFNISDNTSHFDRLPRFGSYVTSTKVRLN